MSALKYASRVSSRCLELNFQPLRYSFPNGFMLEGRLPEMTIPRSTIPECFLSSPSSSDTHTTIVQTASSHQHLSQLPKPPRLGLPVDAKDVGLAA